MTNIKSHPTQAGNRASNQTAKKADPFATLKSSIMIVSIAGTMAGWLILLNQETDTAPVNTAMLTAVTPKDSKESTPPTNINQLRQVNEVAPVEQIDVVARTRSSR